MFSFSSHRYPTCSHEFQVTTLKYDIKIQVTGLSHHQFPLFGLKRKIILVWLEFNTLLLRHSDERQIGSLLMVKCENKLLKSYPSLTKFYLGMLELLRGRILVRNYFVLAPKLIFGTEKRVLEYLKSQVILKRCKEILRKKIRIAIRFTLDLGLVFLRSVCLRDFSSLGIFLLEGSWFPT